MDPIKPTTAFVGTAYVGTEKLGRSLTNAENRQLAVFLREHDFVGASTVALRFAVTKRRNKEAAQDLLGRAQQRLIRHGWDPSEVTLVKRMCRLVWSEHMNEASETATRREAEEGFVREHGITHSAARSAEDQVTRFATENDEEEHSTRRIAALRTAIVAADDKINLLYLDYVLGGIDQPSEMARLSGHDVREFYRAADRRKRHAARLLAAERGAKYEEDE